MNRKFFRALAGVAALTLAAGVASADPLAASTVLTSGPLTFTGFTATINGTGTYTPTTASAISVSALTTGQPGIQFTGGFDAFGAGSSGDVALNYVVSASPGTKISDIFLGLSGAVLVGYSNVSVLECAYADAAHTMPLDGGNCLQVTDPPPVLTGELALGGNYSTVYVTKDINFNAHSCTDTEGGCPAQAGLSIIDQRFSTVPEPGTLALFGAGLLGCGLVIARRRRSMQS